MKRLLLLLLPIVLLTACESRRRESVGEAQAFHGIFELKDELRGLAPGNYEARLSWPNLPAGYSCSLDRSVKGGELVHHKNIPLGTHEFREPVISTDWFAYRLRCSHVSIRDNLIADAEISVPNDGVFSASEFNPPSAEGRLFMKEVVPYMVGPKSRLWEMSELNASAAQFDLKTCVEKDPNNEFFACADFVNSIPTTMYGQHFPWDVVHARVGHGKLKIRIQWGKDWGEKIPRENVWPAFELIVDEGDLQVEIEQIPDAHGNLPPPVCVKVAGKVIGEWNDKCDPDLRKKMNLPKFRFDAFDDGRF